MPFFKNTYRKLDQDTSFNKVDPESYINCRNFRITSNDPSKSGALSTIKGNFPLEGNFASKGYVNDRIIGSRQVRDQMLIFSTDDDSLNPTTSYGRLWLAPFSYDSINMDDIILLYSGLLNFSRQHPIEDISIFYENEDIIKAYWTDNYNYFRYCNIVDPNLMNQDPDEFNIVQKMDLSIPVFNQMVSGNIPVGMVQYAYRLYKLNGPTSNFSPASNLIPLTTASLSMQNTITFKGSNRLDSSGNALSSGKGIVLKIEGIDTDYDRIEIVAIHYSALNEEPKIHIVDIKSVSSTIYVTDEGLYNLGDYTLAQYTLINNPFICKTIDTKNNILFAGNIRQNEFDFDFDARAYRFHNGTQVTTKLYETNGEYWYNGSNNPSLWIHYNASNVAIGSVNGIENLPEDIDAINIYNQVTESLATAYVCQKNGSTIGGEGPNVKYSFESLAGYTSGQRQIDGLGASFTKTFGGISLPAPNYYSSSEGPKVNQDLRTFQRDEIYRVGLIGYDDRGRNSPTKWIGDIRFPNNYASNFCSGTNGDMYSNPLQIKFEINNLPSEVKYVRIVYVKRTDKDKTILFQGKVDIVGTIGSEHHINRPSESTVTNYNNLPTLSKKHIAVFSPDISFYKNFNQGTNDFIEVVGTYSGVVENPNNGFQSLKCHSLTAQIGKTASVSSAKIEVTTPSPDEVTKSDIFGILNNTFYPRMVYSSYENRYMGNLGTCVLIQLANPINTSSLIGSDYMVINYRTNRSGTQYGGNTYEDRTRNEYIPTGNIVSVSSGSATVYATHGDTYISYADHLVSYYNKYYNDFGNNVYWFGAVEMFPVESLVNLAYSLDDCYHRIYNHSPAAYGIREVGNSEFTVDETTYSFGWTDLYLENTVYKRFSDAKKYYPAPLDYNVEFKNDDLVMASDIKEGGETIDPWTQWSTNESINVDKKYGPINKLLSWKNNLLYWQEDAVGILAVLDRSVISDQQGRSTTLGEGTVLQRYDNILTNSGLNTRFSITISPNGVYWYDHKRRRINRFLNNIENLSTIRGVNSYLNSLNDTYLIYDNVISESLTGKGFFLLYNPIYNEIWFTVKDSLESGTALIFNEVIDAFIGFADTKSYFYMNFDNKIFSAYGSGIYKEDKGYPGHFFGIYFDSFVTIVVNPIPNMVATFTNFEVTSEVYESVLDPIIPDGTGPIPPVMYIPSLTTTEITNIDSTGGTAEGGGDITNNGNDIIIAKGICFGISENPDILNNSHTENGVGYESFISILNGLIPATTYYVRSYATNSVGTGYGSQVQFTTITFPSVITSSISDIQITEATGNGEVISDGGGEITARGICWKTSSGPTITDNHTSESGTLGVFSSLMTGLTEGTTYYVRTYATNSKGTVYGNEVVFTTIETTVSDIITTEISDITEISAISGGNVITDGGDPVTSRGVCWSTSPVPTISNYKTINGSGIGSFMSILTGLSQNTTYYIRAYATNGVGTSYGNEIAFTTTAAIIDTDLKDKDGNVYNTSVINDQEWLSSNLKVTKYSDGVSIPEVIINSDFRDDTIGARCWYNNDIVHKDVYGVLYNWPTVNSARNLAYLSRGGSQESGWRVPTETDFNKLNAYLSYWDGILIGGGRLKESGFVHWDSPNTGADNSSGFTAIGAGFYITSFMGLGLVNNLWVSEEYSGTRGNLMQLTEHNSEIVNGNLPKSYFLSVRLIKDDNIISDPVTEISIGTQVWKRKNHDTNYAGSKVYNNNESNRSIYGGLYTWDQVKAGDFCPAGWHVPTLAEWNTLIEFIGSVSNGGGKLKEVGFEHWNSPNSGATNESGFNSLPGGGKYSNEDIFNLMNIQAIYWSKTQYDSTTAKTLNHYYMNAYSYIGISNKNEGHSVRLVRDI
jgi:uncharacterized protein (TIGR02145 family)